MFNMLFVVPLADGGAYYAFQNSDAVGKFIVILLFLGSILTWTIMLEKGLALGRAKRLSQKFIADFRSKASPLGILREARKQPGPVAKVYMSGATKLIEFYDMNMEDVIIRASRGEYPRGHLTASQIDALRTVFEREVSDQIMVLEEKVGMLATAVSVSPFFGLFGTVWGVMMAFCSVASKGRADISALAPGVSGALLTTVVGLLVAIPAVIGYNMLVNQIRLMTVRLDNFTEALLGTLQAQYQHGGGE